MKKTIPELLQVIVPILAKNREEEWARYFENLLQEFDADPIGTKLKIRQTYGGMGTFNDLVLHGSDGIPLKQENDLLSDLQEELYLLVREQSQQRGL
jgi:hypothetical protein